MKVVITNVGLIDADNDSSDCFFHAVVDPTGAELGELLDELPSEFPKSSCFHINIRIIKE
jgi:hypothetical protein